jgi:tetratricopeptide (TPR) repeat protein
MTRRTFAIVSLAAVATIAASTGPAAQRQPVTFNDQVAPIIFANCSGCHRPGESAPFSLLNYADAKQRARLIADVTANHVMPPWQPDSAAGEFKGDRRLSAAEIDTFRQWVEEGAPEGDPDRRPAAPAFPNGWRLGVPDVVITMAEPFTVPAGGPDVFRNFVLPVPLRERRFVQALEFRPGNPRVLHHARILLDDTGEVRRLDGHGDAPGFGGMEVPGARFPDGHFLGWAPGQNPSREQFQWPIEPGTDFVVQMHLTPTGRAETVQASIGIYLTEAPPPAIPLMLRLGSKTIDIAPGATAYKVTDTYVLPVDVSVLSVYPHAHYLATEMVVTAKRPNGSVQTLLRIPRWNFNWQDDYAYAQPIALPRGTTIVMSYSYDNSAANPRNPSAPPKRVRFGSDTSDEMGELLLQVLPAKPSDLPALRLDAARKNLLADVAGEEKRIADVPGDSQTRIALGVAYVQLGRAADAVAQFQQVLRLAPEHAMAHYNLGVIAMGDRRIEEAILAFDRAIAARPDYAEAHNNLGVALESIGRVADATDHYRAALDARPSHPAAHNNLGRVLLARGDLAEAMGHFRTALAARPDNPDALYNFGRALVATGERRQAVQEWKRALAVRPDSAAVLIDFAWLLIGSPELRNGADATSMAEQANRVTGGNNPLALDVLAAAYASADRTELAIDTAQKALQRALALKNDSLALQIRQRLELYQQRRPDLPPERGIP